MGELFKIKKKFSNQMQVNKLKSTFKEDFFFFKKFHLMYFLFDSTQLKKAEKFNPLPDLPYSCYRLVNSLAFDDIF
jgi:hypothetical protein